jgi:hypothetical protein
MVLTVLLELATIGKVAGLAISPSDPGVQHAHFPSLAHHSRRHHYVLRLARLRHVVVLGKRVADKYVPITCAMWSFIFAPSWFYRWSSTGWAFGPLSAWRALPGKPGPAFSL